MSSTPSAAQHQRTDPLLPIRPARPSRSLRALQLLAVLALVPVLAFYLYPRIYDLVATPYRLDQAIVYADRYNPALHRMVAAEEVTLAAFSTLDRMDAAVANVRATDARVADELSVLIGQIRGDLQATLDGAGHSVQALNGSLNDLEQRVRALHSPVDGADRALAGNRAKLAAILDDARSTAADVRAARRDAEQSADNVSGN